MDCPSGQLPSGRPEPDHPSVAARGYNLVNVDDVWAAGRQLRRRPFWLAGRLLPGKARRVVATWGRAGEEATHFWDVPAVLARTQERATGRQDLPTADYLAAKYLQRSGLRGLSIGCGFGVKESRWAATGRFDRLDCYDLAPEAVRAASELHTHPALAFGVGNAYELEFEPGSFDVIVFQDSLHHLAPVRSILERCHRWLCEDGLLFVSEYTGPRKFQYSDRQLEAANALLALLPEERRVGFANGKVKRRIVRPSRLRMHLLDPSEAVDSESIVPGVRELFDVLEERPLGGTLVNLVLDDIAQHFRDDGDVWLRLMFEVEDALLAEGEIGSDYVLMAARKRS